MRNRITIMKIARPRFKERRENEARLEIDLREEKTKTILQRNAYILFDIHNYIFWIFESILYFGELILFINNLKKVNANKKAMMIRNLVGDSKI